MSVTVPDVAALIEQGARYTQQDAVRVEAHGDGSWMLAVADGTGFGVCPDDAASAALDGLPARVSGDGEMLDAFVAADEAVAALYHGPGVKPETTLAVAAWTPEAGLTAGWVGDTLIWMAPLGGHVTWWGRPTKMRSPVPLIGQFGSRRSLSAAIRLLSNDLTRETVDTLIAAGMIVLVMSDGAYAHPSMAEAKHLTFHMPVAARRSAQCAARWVIAEAAADKLHDNATVAAARIPPPPRGGGLRRFRLAGVTGVMITASDEALAAVKYNDDGLVAAIVQDAATKAVLMMAWMSAETLALTLAEGRTVFWSRSRQEVWRKGETSGERQWVREAYYDCDGDTLLFVVDQDGDGACHTGAYSCFFRSFDGADPAQPGNG